MSENGSLTPREVKLCREAFVEGVRYAIAPQHPQAFAAEDAALRHYPMPSVPRVVQDRFETRWRAVRGLLQWYTPNNEWREVQAADGWCLTTDRVVLLADLLANPTEQRPADEVETR